MAGRAGCSGPSRHQQLRYSTLPAIDGALQGRGPFAVPCFDCRAAIEQRPRNLHVAPPRRHMQRSRPGDPAARVHVRTGLHQHPDDLGSCLRGALVRHTVEGCVSAAALNVQGPCPAGGAARLPRCTLRRRRNARVRFRNTGAPPGRAPSPRNGVTKRINSARPDCIIRASSPTNTDGREATFGASARTS